MDSKKLVRKISIALIVVVLILITIIVIYVIAKKNQTIDYNKVVQEIDSAHSLWETNRANGQELTEVELWNQLVEKGLVKNIVDITYSAQTAKSKNYYIKLDDKESVNLQISKSADKTSPSFIGISNLPVSCVVDKEINPVITQVDEESGVFITKCKWVFNTKENEIGTDESIYIGGTFDSTSQPISITAHTPGKYYLHILTVDKAGNSKETISSVVNINRIAKNIRLNESEIKMNVGETKELTVDIKPDDVTNKSIEWISNNSSVVTVDSNGMLEAKGEGTAIITATAIDGSGITATCMVTVISNK